MSDYFNVADIFGENVFNDTVMQERLPKKVYKKLHEVMDEGKELDLETADVIAHEMKEWAIEKGATHYTHWFQPLTGVTAEKHDSFITAPMPNGKVLMSFSGKELIKGEPDASSFPSGGLRATFEARGYTAWDCTSPAFVRQDAAGATLCIPTAFCSYTGEALDQKTPLLRSMEAIDTQSIRLLILFGNTTSKKVTPSVGPEQEYFIVDRQKYLQRKDLIFTGRTLFGAMPPKGQEMDDHYFGAIRERIAAYMKDVNKELWKLGVSAKTQHNEVAPAQHEVACVYTVANVTADNNALVMQLSQDIAKKHGLRCLLHEKPFEGVNGSGKHNNWSLLTNTGINLFSPGPDPINNKPFLATLACAIKGVDEYAELLRLSAACAGNDHRLGANEAPPAIVSAFVGDDLNKVIKAIIDGEELNKTTGERFTTGVSVIPDFSKDSTDRNRTSPFAFTGNKFEFRMVGSSQSVAAVNTMLNAIMAEEYDQMAAKLDAGESLDDIIREFFKNHERIIFNGDGYSEEWKEEAARRGLPNHANSVDACACLKKPEIREMFVKHGVFTEAEIDSRYDIQLDNYAKTIRVEALTALSMAKTELYPAYVKACGTLANDAKEVAKAGVDNTFMVEDLKVLTSLLSTMREQMITLEDAINKAESTDSSTLDTATAWKDLVIPAMDSLRATADSLETKVSAQQYPIPNYIDLLFGI